MLLCYYNIVQQATNLMKATAFSVQVQVVCEENYHIAACYDPYLTHTLVAVAIVKPKVNWPY